MAKLILILMLLANFSFSWDGARQGFLLGFGAGATNITYSLLGAEDGELFMLSMMDPIFTSRIGYAWNDQQAVEIFSIDFTSSFAIAGLNYHSWSMPDVQSNEWFGGIGILRENYGSRRFKGEDLPDADVGFAANFGYAREIASHASIETGIVMGGITFDTQNPEADMELVTAFYVSINLLGY